MRPRNRNLLPRHPHRRVFRETLRQPGVGLHKQLIADSIHHVYIARRCGRPTVSRVDRREPLRNRRQRNTV